MLVKICNRWTIGNFHVWWLKWWSVKWQLNQWINQPYATWLESSKSKWCFKSCSRSWLQGSDKYKKFDGNQRGTEPAEVIAKQTIENVECQTYQYPAPAGHTSTGYKFGQMQSQWTESPTTWSKGFQNKLTCGKTQMNSTQNWKKTRLVEGF